MRSARSRRNGLHPSLPRLTLTLVRATSQRYASRLGSPSHTRLHATPRLPPHATLCAPQGAAAAAAPASGCPRTAARSCVLCTHTLALRRRSAGCRSEARRRGRRHPPGTRAQRAQPSAPQQLPPLLATSTIASRPGTSQVRSVWTHRNRNAHARTDAHFVSASRRPEPCRLSHSKTRVRACSGRGGGLLVHTHHAMGVIRESVRTSSAQVAAQAVRPVCPVRVLVLQPPRLACLARRPASARSW